MTKVSPSARDISQNEIIRRLEEDIIFGKLAPGSRLVEDVLIERYDASRHSIRQALQHLERIGIVLREKNIGATIRSYSADEVHQIYEVREMLTRQASLMIPLPAPKRLIARLQEIQARYIKSAKVGNLRGIHETNDEFHIQLFSACGNPYLVGTLQDYMNLTLPMRAKTLADSDGLLKSFQEHDLMIDLLSGRDHWALAKLCVDHMYPSKADYLTRIGAQKGRWPILVLEQEDGGSSE